MIRQLCPHCLKLAELPDSASGSTVKCPLCNKPFSIPENYSPSVDANAGPGADPRSASPVPPPATEPKASDVPAPPAGLVLPKSSASAYPATASSPPSAAPASVPLSDADYKHAWGITLAPGIIDWIPVSALTLILILTVFPWVGSYPGGTKVYSQYPWQAIFGNFERNIALEELLKDESAIEQKIGWNFWLMIYLPALMATVFLAWLERLVHDPKPETVPGPLAWLPSIWNSRFSLLTGLSLLIFLVLLFQLWRGFGLEVAIKQIIAENYADQAAKADTTPAKQRLSVKLGQELASRGLQGTWMLHMALVAHVVAIGFMLLRWWQHYRGPSQPAPWIGVRF